MPREELVKLRRPNGEMFVVSRVSVQESDELSRLAVVEPPQFTLEELADYADEQETRSEGVVDLGINRLLAALLYRLLGRQQATAVMYEIACWGGIRSMAEQENCFLELGILPCWENWALPLAQDLQ
jgi:hypothetical protein